MTVGIYYTIKSVFLREYNKITCRNTWCEYCKLLSDTLVCERWKRQVTCTYNIFFPTNFFYRLFRYSVKKKRKKERKIQIVILTCWRFWIQYKMNCELMLTYDTSALRQTGSRNLMGQKMLPTIRGTYMKLVTKYQIPVINSCWEKCDKKCAYTNVC